MPKIKTISILAFHNPPTQSIIYETLLNASKDKVSKRISELYHLNNVIYRHETINVNIKNIIERLFTVINYPKTATIEKAYLSKVKFYEPEIFDQAINKLIKH